MEMTDKDSKEFIRDNKSDHAKLFGMVDLLRKELTLASTIGKFTRYIAGILLLIITVLLSIITSNSIHEKSMERNMLTSQQENLVLTYQYIQILDSISKQFEKRDESLLRIDSLIWGFYRDEYVPEQKRRWDLFHEEVVPNTVRSKKNEKDIKKLQQRQKKLNDKIGIY